ncbi:MAG: winged helix-turn-helix domain-containing protein [Photobacterium frigidiphilum]|uniref:helix-turn-helix domain-containing protein n=1 Tax=Photobacterium frigidiphilum TaxID=264736 RepID=UPI0030024745
MDSLNNIDFKSLARKQTSIQMKMHFLALAHFQDGHSRTLIAKFLKVSRTNINKWIQVFLEEGLDGLKEKPRTRRPSFLPNQERQQLDNAAKPDGGRLTGHDIHNYITQTFGRVYNPDYIYILLKKMGFSWITSRSKHPKQSDEIQESFKNSKSKRSLRPLIT